MSVTVDKLLGKPLLHKHKASDITGSAIEQLDADPVAPDPEQAWILKTVVAGGSGAGEAYGLLLSLTQPGDGASTAYQLSYRTKEDTTVRITLE